MASIFEDKQFLLVVVAWFIFSFVALWFMGGACLNPVKGTECFASGKLDFLRNVPIVGLFFPYDVWTSIMYFLAPIAGFIFAFTLINWWNDYFETEEAAGIGFFILIVLALLVGYWVNLSFYVGEAANLNSNSNVKYSLYFCFAETAASDCSTTVQKNNAQIAQQYTQNNVKPIPQAIPVYFWGELRKSMYLIFVLGCLAGWLPLFVRTLYKQFKQSE